MKTLALTLPAGLLLVGCGDGTPPSAYKHPRDQIFAAVPLPMIDEDFVPCFRTVEGQPGRLPTAECYRMTEPQRIRGVWANGFEESSFYPARTSPPPPDAKGVFWLEPEARAFSPEQRRQVPLRCRETCFIYLDFIGRRTVVEGRYGHLGLAKHYVVADRVITAKVLR